MYNHCKTNFKLAYNNWLKIILNFIFQAKFKPLRTFKSIGKNFDFFFHQDKYYFHFYNMVSLIKNNPIPNYFIKLICVYVYLVNWNICFFQGVELQVKGML